MLKVVKDFGLGTLGFTKNDFLIEGLVSQVDCPPLRIDILNSIDGVEFDNAYKNKLTIKLDTLSVDYIGRRDLIQNKQSTGRIRDLADIMDIQNMPKTISKKRNKPNNPK